MTFLFEKPESLVVAGVNWPVLEYLIDRFNRADLEGCIVLRRTPLLKDLQLYLTAECNGHTLSMLSETFEDAFLTDGEQREQLIRVVSRFLLRAKHQHAELLASSTPKSSYPHLDVFGQGASKVHEEASDGANVTNQESSGESSD